MTVLQQGLLGYSGTNDTYITNQDPSANLATQPNLMVRNDGTHEGLLRFNVVSIGSEAIINRATLKLYAYGSDVSAPLDVRVHALLRDWVDTQANWVQAMTDSAWGLPGANDTQTDRSADPVATCPVLTPNGWYIFDVTVLVREWVADPEDNYGLILRGSGADPVSYSFASANYPVVSVRPQLLIEYIMPLRSSTPTPLPPGQNVVVLQQGLLGYGGANDTYITDRKPSANLATQANLIVRNDSTFEGLLRFDVLGIPAGATVHRAGLKLYAYSSDSSAPLDVQVHGLLRDWVDAEANWVQATTASAWGSPGANDTQTDRSAMPVATSSVHAPSNWYTFDVTALVQAWLANPGGNHGLILRGSGAEAVAYSFASGNYPIVSVRPQLVIDYTTPSQP